MAGAQKTVRRGTRQVVVAPDTDRTNQLVAATGALLVVIIGGALLVDTWRDSHAPVAWAVASTAVITFFGSVLLMGGPKSITKEQMTNAIAAAFITTYLVLIGLVAFLSQRAPKATNGSTQAAATTPEITDTLITNFTILMGLVMTFYFGTSAYLRALEIQRGRSEEVVEEEDLPKS